LEIFNVSNRILSGFGAGVLLICLSIPAHLTAQGNTATIAGTITDPSGAAVPDVALEVRSVETGARQSTASDGQGRFRVPQLSLGTYEVQAVEDRIRDDAPERDHAQYRQRNRN
jgi:hypothetical protein